MKSLGLKQVVSYTVMGISSLLIGILLMPICILTLLLSIVWSMADTLIYWVERK